MIDDTAISQEIERYIHTGFSSRALNELYLGLKAGIDVSDFAKREYNELQMRSLRLAKEEGIDITAFLNPDLSHKQMNALFYGISQGVEVKDLINPAIHVQQIEEEINTRIIKKKDGLDKPSLAALISGTADKKTPAVSERKWEGNRNNYQTLDTSQR